MVWLLKFMKRLGPAFLKNSYLECLYFKILQAGLIVEKQKAMPLVFEGVHLECGYRIDLLIENKLVVEVKSVEAMNNIFIAQVLTYLRLGDFRLGLLINFNVLLLKDGIRRVINGDLIDLFDDSSLNTKDPKRRHKEHQVKIPAVSLRILTHQFYSNYSFFVASSSFISRATWKI